MDYWDFYYSTKFKWEHHSRPSEKSYVFFNYLEPFLKNKNKKAEKPWGQSVSSTVYSEEKMEKSKTRSVL